MALALVAFPGPLPAKAGLPQGYGSAPPPPPPWKDGAPPPGAPMPPPGQPMPPPPPPPPPMPVAAAPVEDATPSAPVVLPGSVADLEEKLAAARRSNNSTTITDALIALARAQVDAGAPAQALARAEEAETLAARYDNHRQGREASLAMAAAYGVLGDEGMQDTWTRRADQYRERIEREIAPLAEAPVSASAPAGAAAPALASPATIIVEKPAPAHSAAWWLLVPVAALLLWGWLRSSRKADALHETAERLSRHQKHLRQAHQTLQQQADHLRQTATQDALTGVLTRQAFAHASEELLHHAQHYGKPVALLLFDLDHFKAINDSHGHLTGDTALKLVVGVVREVLDSEDLFGRFGGDEFLIASIGRDADSARALAERIRQAVRERALSGDPALSALSLSIGVALAGAAQGHDLSPLFARADAALYEAKRAGRNRVVLDDPALALPGNSHFPMRSLSASPDA